jgi:hypothetical protein
MTITSIEDNNVIVMTFDDNDGDSNDGNDDNDYDDV